ncbi:MAG: FAD-dependent oxidoreductase [Geothrix sp.]|uniref:protoporphyrinogen/coproporphyrinogen oxidase n=1 Tax=Geothrix sp. TaxID=1962974 RepID=UPI00184EA5DB|nr:FAD-dependent oxidoreductase [Geothrix sp.]NWJ40592.1 FAD-dependent oxidoreductase [Geothrix sp.]WIL21404.1 MAG: FAD-dependent oxidoreductase [Geothrix sp.]
MDTTAHRARVIVLGGGISGLLAAWHLQRRGREVEVWEAASAVGGWAQTLAWPGPQGEPGWLERGPQGLRVAREGALARLLLELDLEPYPTGPKGPRWLGKDGRRHPGPATFGGLLRAPGLSLGEKLRMLAEPLIPARTDPDETLHAFFARRLGAGFARELLPALVGGVLAAPPERLGLDAFPRLRQLDAHGGLLLGGLRLGAERTRLLPGGTGTLARSLAERLGCVRTGTPVQTLEVLPGGRWRVRGEGLASEADAVVVALPSRQAASLLAPVSQEAARLLEGIPSLDLRVWHSRHAPVPGWERGFGLLVHPPEGRGLLGAVAFAEDDPRGVPGLLQVRTYLGGTYPVAPELDGWPGVFGELRRWLPELPEAIQVREEACPGAFPLLEPGHGGRVARLVQALPPGLHWVGAARFGPGLPELTEGLEAWAGAPLP